MTDYRTITPYSRVKFRVFNHNALKKDVFIAETILDLYGIFKKYNGAINNVSFPLPLKLPNQNSSKSILSSRGPNYIFISIDGVSINMRDYPESNAQNRDVISNGSAVVTTENDSQPSTSSNVVAEITSSLPKWSLNDPYSNSTHSNGPSSSINNHKSKDSSKSSNQSRKSTTIEASNLPSTSTSSSTQINRPNVQSNLIEESLPPGWEIRFDTYGR